MEETKEKAVEAVMVRGIVQEAIREFLQSEQQRAEPAYKTELVEERKRREQLERRVNELVEENRRSRALAEEAERSAAVRTELQRLGVQKVDLAFKAVRDEIVRSEDGRLVARGAQGELGLREYLTQFVNENPELLPARIAGGSGASGGSKGSGNASAIDLDKIKPGMSKEELEKVRQEVARIARQTFEGERT